jgi:Plavaka transposase
VRFPQQFDDYLPTTRTALAHIPSKERRNPPQVIVDPISHPHSMDISSPAITGIDENHMTCDDADESPLDDSAPETNNADCFGIYRMYARKPLRDPLQRTDPNMPCDTLPSSECRPAIVPNQGPPHLDLETMPYYHPFSNPSAAAMMVAHHSGALVQSLQQTTQIAHILGSLGSDLSPLDLSNFDATVENRKIDAYLTSTPENVFQREDGWLESSVQIRLPLDKGKMLESKAAVFDVGGVFHRDIIDVISSVYQSDVVRSFNLIPFKEFWKPSEDAPPERLYGEIFSSQVMLDTDDDIYKCSLGNDSDSQDLEAVSVPLLLYSDSTHLANFGNASCWPIYLFFGSQSKYVRDMPSSFACHHIAYMPSVRNIQVFTISSDIVTSCLIAFKISIRNSTRQMRRPPLLLTAKGNFSMQYYH